MPEKDAPIADIRPFLLKPDASLLDALTRLSANGAGFGVVADGDRAVLGTVTDAEIRKKIVNGVSTTERVDSAMTPKLTRQKRLPAALRVEGGRLVDIELQPPATAPPIGVVMAGGRGKRLRPITDKVPKPLLKVGRWTIIERIMRALVAAGVEDIYVSLNYKAKMFERRLGSGEQVGATLHYLHEDAPLGTAGALAMLPRGQSAPVFVTNADIITRLDYARVFEYHDLHGGWATMTGVEHVTQIPYGVLRTDGDRLVLQEEKPVINVLCNAGMYVLDPRVLSLVKQDEYLDMPTLLERVMARRHAVHVFPVVERWIDSGSPDEFERVMIDVATGAEEYGHG